METEQRFFSHQDGWTPLDAPGLGASAQLVLAFGSRNLLADCTAMRDVQGHYPHAQIVGCSTAGEIAGTRVSDDSVVVTAVSFEQTRIRATEVKLCGAVDSAGCGEQLATTLLADDLVHVLVLSDGLNVNGSELVKGLASRLPKHVAVTGGLSGDGARFEKTLVFFNGKAMDHRIVAVGFYGDKLRVGYGSQGGWHPFGPDRVVTKSQGNVIYELDGEAALGLYKRYLGPHAVELPSSGLRFPLSINTSHSTPVVRTILGIEEKDQSLIFAGDIPQGVHARLMRASADKLISGATFAARATQEAIRNKKAQLALLISCVGRKLVLGQRVEEEIEAVSTVLGDSAALTGFYSYGEICPFIQSSECELHNQTMTVTVFTEEA